MKKIGKVITIIAVISGVIFWGIVIAFFISVIKAIGEPSDVTDIRKSISISYTGNGGTSGISSENREDLDLEWYETLEEALENDELIRDKGEELGGIDYKDDNVVELLQIQTDDYMAVFYCRVMEDGEVGRITYVILHVKDGKISQPFKLNMAGNKPGYESLSGKSRNLYDCDDGAVFYIEQEIVIRRIFGTGENRIPVCFGMWDDESEIRSLTIAGTAPKVIPIVTEKETRYFWYFEDLEWADRLSEVNWSQYTYGEIIDLLEIEYEPSN